MGSGEAPLMSMIAEWAVRTQQSPVVSISPRTSVALELEPSFRKLLARLRRSRLAHSGASKLILVEEQISEDLCLLWLLPWCPACRLGARRLRINPMMPYNALNYGLGMTACRFDDYLVGMVGAVPYSAITVYAGMVISSIKDMNSIFSQESTLWYCIYGALIIVCVSSFIAIALFASAEMKVALDASSSPQAMVHLGGDRDYGGDSGNPELSVFRDGDSTAFGTFVARTLDPEGCAEEYPGAAVDGVSSWVPLLGGRGAQECGAQVGASRGLMVLSSTDL